MKKRKCVKLVAVCKELYIKEEKFESYFIEEENRLFIRMCGIENRLKAA